MRDGQKGPVDMSCVDNLNIEPTDRETDVLITKYISFDASKQDEIMKWYSVSEDVDDVCVSTRWVCSLKETPSGIEPKARLVARSFEKLNIHKLQKDSPTCASESLRLLLTVICQNKWQFHSMDIKSAFLQGMQLSREIYVRPPAEAGKENILWKLKKCVYGLADASLYWYNKLKEIMLSTGGKIYQVDPAVSYWLDEQCKVTGVLACHVDDFLWVGSPNISTDVIPILKSAFYVGREEHENFCYVGMNFATTNGVVHVHQNGYIENLQPICLLATHAVQIDASLNEIEKRAA